MQRSINLSGEWKIYKDFEEQITSVEHLYENIKWESIQVPGCWETSESNKKNEGPVWYQKSFYLPNEWEKEELLIEFEGVNYFCEIWLNDKFIGAHQGGWNKFSINLPVESILAGTQNVLIVKVYKQGEKFPIREHLAGFLPDVGVIFGGIWKPVYVRIQPSILIQDVFVKPRISKQQIELDYKTQLSNSVGGERVTFAIFDRGKVKIGEKSILVRTPKDILNKQKLQISFTQPAVLWEPENPVLYTLEILIEKMDKVIDRQEIKFGMREITTQGKKLLINGNPIYLRGALHWGWYGKHIAPIPSRKEIREELQKIKEQGFNMVKHCLYVPVQDYYDIADEMGILLWQELPMWLPSVKEGFESRVFYQYENIIKEVRNHPSIILWTLGCELNQSVCSNFLERLYKKTKELTDGALVRDNSGSGECYGGLLKEFADFYDYHFYNDVHFYSDLIHQFAGSWRETKPWFFGEFCDYDIFRNIRDIRGEHNGELPWWLKNNDIENPGSSIQSWRWSEQEERVDAWKLPFTEEELHKNSVKSALVYRKTVLELVRQYNTISGYSLTSINSNPIATSGIFDDYGQPYHSLKDFRRFNSDTVLLLTWDNKRSWINGGDRLIHWDPYNYISKDVIRPHFFISHYGAKDIYNANLLWEVSEEGECEPYSSGVISNLSLYKGEAKEVGVAEFVCPPVNEPKKLLLTATLVTEKSTLNNQWEFWAFPEISILRRQQPDILIDDPLHVLEGIKEMYPKSYISDKLSSTTQIILTSHLTDGHKAFMENGGSVFYIQRGTGHFSISSLPFWRESIQLYYRHPVTDAFPHDNHTNLAMYGLAADTAFELQNLGDVINLVGRLDARNFDLHSYMFEKEVGKGKLIATTLRFDGGLGSQPSGIKYNPAASFWLNMIIQYMLEGRTDCYDGIQYLSQSTEN